MQLFAHRGVRQQRTFSTGLSVLNSKAIYRPREREGKKKHLQSSKPETYGSTLSDPSIIYDGEKEFIQNIAQRGDHAYLRWLSEQVRLFRSAREPLTGRQNALEFLKDSKRKVTYSLVGAEMAASGEMACVYGQATVALSQNVTPETGRYTYVRFWKKEKGTWKIVVDLLSG